MFDRLCKETGPENISIIIFYCASEWLSQENFITCVFTLRGEIY